MNNEEVQLIDDLDQAKVDDLVGFVEDDHREIGVDYGDMPGIEGAAELETSEATGADDDPDYVAPVIEQEEEIMIGGDESSDNESEKAAAS